MTVVLIVAAACTPSSTTAVPTVSVVELDAATWRATWHFAEPVRGLRFERPAHFFREQAWRVLTPGYALARDGDDQVVVAADGVAAVRELRIEFPVDTRKRPREYELFHRFTDGSIAVYTGHFHARPLDGGPAVERAVVDSAAGRRVSMPDDVAGGTYAVVGPIRAQRTAHMTAFIDPGLPPWLRATAERRIPQFFDLLTERTGHVLGRRPLVLFTFVPGSQAGYESAGGALHGLIHLGAYGDAWREPDPWAERSVLRFIAHEAVHLWNAQLARFESGAPPWMHEGSADALAERLLLAGGLIDAADLAAYRAAAARACFAGEAFDYHCGNLAAVWTEAAVADARAGLDLFGFWARLIAASDRGRYAEADYFRVLGALGVPRDAVAAFARVVQAGSRDPDDWSALFARYGVTLE